MPTLLKNTFSAPRRDAVSRLQTWWAAALLAVGLPAVSGQIVFTWDGGPDSSYDGAWVGPLNWTANIGFPGPLDTARFNVGQTYSVGIDGHPGADKVEVTAGNVRFDVGALSELHIGNQLKVENATLRVANGPVTANDAYLFNANIRLEGGHLKITGQSSPERPGHNMGLLTIQGHGVFEANLDPWHTGVDLSFPSVNVAAGSVIRAEGGDLLIRLSSSSSLAGQTKPETSQIFRNWYGDVDTMANTLVFDTGTSGSLGRNALSLNGAVTLGGGTLSASGSAFLNAGLQGRGLVEADYLQILGKPSADPGRREAIVLTGALTLRARNRGVLFNPPEFRGNPTPEAEATIRVQPVLIGGHTLRIEAASISRDGRVEYQLAGGQANHTQGWSYYLDDLSVPRSGFTGYGLIGGRVALEKRIESNTRESADPTPLFRPTGAVAVIDGQSIGTGSLTVLSNAPVAVNGAITLAGGELRSTGGWVMGAGGSISGAGSIIGVLPGLSGLNATAALTDPQTYFGGATPVFWLSTAPVTMRAPERVETVAFTPIPTPLPVTMTNSLLWSPGGIAIDGVALSGTGELRGPVSGTGSLTLGGAFVIGDSASTAGVAYQGAIEVGAHTLTLRDANAAQLGGNVTLGGGTIAAANGVAFGGNFTGSGTVAGAVSGAGTLTATGNLTLGDATSPNGFVFDGTLHVGSHRVTLLSLGSSAFLGPLTTLAGGVLASPTGFSLHTGEQVTGHGVLLGAMGGALGSGALQPTAGLTFASDLAFGSGDAWILSQGDATFSGALTLAGGTVNGTTGARLRLAGGGAFSGFGTMNVLLDATAGNVAVGVGTLNLAAGGNFGGTTTVSAGSTLQLGGGTTRFLSGSVSNLAALTVTGGTAGVEIGATFAANAVTVTAGSLTFAAGTTGSLANAAPLTVSGNGTLTLNADTVLPVLTTVSGNGTATGTLNGSGALQVDSGRTLRLDRGALTGGGLVDVRAGGTLDLITNGATLSRSVVNAGTVRLNPVQTTGFFLGGSATLENLAGGTLRFLDAPLTATDANYNSIRATGLDVINRGLMTVGALTAQTGNAAQPWLYLDRSLTNSGTLSLLQSADVNVFGTFNHSGSLTLAGDSFFVAHGGGTSTGTIALGSNADSFMAFRGATVHDTGTTFSGSGYLSVEGGNLNTPAGVYQPTVNLELLGGVTLPAASSLTIGSGRWLRVAGPISALPIRVAGGGQLQLVGGTNTNAITVDAGGTAKIGSTYASTMNYVRDQLPTVLNAVAGQPGRGDLVNQGTVEVVPGRIAGTGRLINEPGGVSLAVSGLATNLQEMLLETINRGLLRLEARDEDPNLFHTASYSGGIRFGNVTNTGTVVLRAIESSYDAHDDVSVRLGAYTQTAGSTTIETTRWPAGAFPDPFIQADTFNILGGSVTATGRMIVPTIANQALFQVGSAGLTVTGAFSNQSGGDLRLDGPLNLSSTFSFGSGSRLLLNGPSAEVFQGGMPTYANSLDTAAGTTLEIRNRTLNGNSNLATAGTLIVGAGAAVERWGGAMNGNGTVRVASGGHLNLYFDFNGTGSGPIEVESGGRLTLNGSREPVRLYDRPITNRGTVDHLASPILVNGATRFTNYGVWTESAGANYANGDGRTGTGVFKNEAGAVFRKPGTGTVSLQRMTFENAGTIEVLGGALAFDAGATFASSTVATIAAGATLQVRETGTIAGGARFEGAGTLHLNAPTTITGSIFASNGITDGPLSGDHTLRGNWTAGYHGWQDSVGTTRIGHDGAYTIHQQANDAHRYYNHTLVNDGTVHHLSSSIRTNPGTTITNNALWLESSGGSFTTGDGQTAGGQFNNAGTFRKLAANTVTFDTHGPAFSNAGTVELTAGSLYFASGRLSNHVGGTLTGGTWDIGHGTYIRHEYASLTKNQAHLTLRGTGFFWDQALTRNEGTLRLLDGQAFAAPNSAFTNTGTLEVGPGSSFTTPSSLTNSGTLKVTGTLTASGGLTNTGTLTGAGTFAGSLVSGGILSPGASPGLLAVTGNLTLQTTSQLLMELGGTARGTTYDALNVSGTLTFGGALVVTAIDGFTPAAGNSFDLFNFTTGASTFTSVTLPSLGPNLAWDTSALYTTGFLNVTVSAIPEPSTYAALAGAGALALAWWRRRRRA